MVAVMSTAKDQVGIWCGRGRGPLAGYKGKEQLLSEHMLYLLPGDF